jgi:6-pyruvoyltetrahydropterin/6-carboxytetrahydropterin synthase
MLLTVSKRLEFSASRRLFVPRWTASENLVAFGPESEARYGTGRNYVAYFVFTGAVDAETGMLINISEIKRRAGDIINERYDHKFLNQDNPDFRPATAGPPTCENIAHQLYVDVAPRFSDNPAKLVAVHLRESPGRSATYYASGACDANYWFEFSAARETRSPHLSAAENEKLFGRAVSTHGHNYRARLSFETEKMAREQPIVRHDAITKCIHSLRSELDHRHLNRDVDAFKNRPTTTESLAEYIYERVNALVPLHRIRLHEREDFFTEVWDDGSMFAGIRAPFSAAHRLHVRTFSETQNTELFGKCNNPAGHGHNYIVEATIGGDYDERTGTLCDFVALQSALADALEPWRDRHLDLETEDFRENPSTGENIVRALWPKIDNRIRQRLVRLRLWETANNRFTLRRTS